MIEVLNSISDTVEVFDDVCVDLGMGIVPRGIVLMYSPQEHRMQLLTCTRILNINLNDVVGIEINLKGVRSGRVMERIATMAFYNRTLFGHPQWFGGVAN